MFAVISAVLFGIALVLHLIHQGDYIVETFWLAGCLSFALALIIPAIPATWIRR